jgi:hypothetical protein
VDGFVVNNGFASQEDLADLAVQVESATQMFLTTNTCPAGYAAVGDRYIKLGTTGLSTATSTKPGHVHSRSLDSNASVGHEGVSIRSGATV